MVDADFGILEFIIGGKKGNDNKMDSKVDCFVRCRVLKLSSTCRF